MPVPRFRVRTLMIAVALVGSAIAGYRGTAECLRLRAEYRRKAAFHSRHEASARKHVALADQGQRNAEEATAEAEQQVAVAEEKARDAPESDQRARLMEVVRYRKTWRDYWAGYVELRRRQRAQYERIVAHHSALARRYARATRYPWWSVPEDPEEPEDPLLWEDMRPKRPPLRFDF